MTHEHRVKNHEPPVLLFILSQKCSKDHLNDHQHRWKKKEVFVRKKIVAHQVQPNEFPAMTGALMPASRALRAPLLLPAEFLALLSLLPRPPDMK